MSYMISDGDFSVGIQLLDPNHDYATLGPYRAVEGDSAAAKLRNPNTNVAATVASRKRTNPDQFELSFKPTELFGSAYCAIDDGHKIVAQFSDRLKLSKGLIFELYRYKSIERYTINYIEVTVYQDSPKVGSMKIGRKAETAQMNHKDGLRNILTFYLDYVLVISSRNFEELPSFFLIICKHHSVCQLLYNKFSN